MSGSSAGMDGYYDSIWNKWVYSDGHTASFSVTLGEMVATHYQDGSSWVPWDTAPSWTAPNSVFGGAATAVNGGVGGVPREQGFASFQKGKSYLSVFSAKEQGTGNTKEILQNQQYAHLYGWKYTALNIDNKGKNESWADFLNRSFGNAKFDGIFYQQHGNLSGPVDKSVTALFAALTPALSGYANDGATIYATQCRGMIDAAFLGVIKESYGVQGAWTASGYNSEISSGIISYMPVNPGMDDGRFYGNRYLPWEFKK
jgi:hypothetical protein